MIVSTWRIAEGFPGDGSVETFRSLMLPQEDEGLRFDILLPLPEVLLDLRRSEIVLDGEPFSGWILDSDLKGPKTGQRRLVRAIGEGEDPEACRKAWGTPEPPREALVLEDTRDALRIRFQTHETPPVPVLETILEKIPSIRIEAFHADAAAPDRRFSTNALLPEKKPDPPGRLRQAAAGILSSLTAWKGKSP